MTFSSIVKKNFVHNFNKYISFYFVNALIVAMLFMYGSLMYNETILESVGKSTLSETIKIALCALVVFSIIFITYTNKSFLKNRGKEFGMYLTLGVTTKDLSKLILLENLGIMIASIVTGLLGGTIFARLFYMVLNKLLETTNVIFKFESKSLLLSIGIFAIIFIINMIFNAVYIRRVSIIKVIKSSKNKEVGKGNVLLGAVALILLVVSLLLLPKTLMSEIFGNARYMCGVFIGITIIAPYIIIGSLLFLVKEITKRFPKIYNKNILMLSNLSHRFLAYKNIIYMVSLLMAGVMFFVGFSYSVYASSRKAIEVNSAYDFMFIESNKYNKVNKEEIEDVLKKHHLEKYNELEYLRSVEISNTAGKGIAYRNSDQLVISEDNFNKVTKENVKVNKGEAIYVTIYEETMDYEYPNVALAPISDEEILEFEEGIESSSIINNEFYNEFFKDKKVINLENISSLKGVKFMNYINHDYGSALVVSNDDYEVLKEELPDEKVEIAHLINSKNKQDAFNDVKSYLKDKNGLDDSYWESLTGILYGKYPEGERGEAERKMPVSTSEMIEMSIESNGITFFTMIFIGLLFLISIGVILYYKILSDIEEERVRTISLRRIATTDLEIKKSISKEIAITFLMPLLVGGGLGYYYLYIMVSNSEMKNMILKESIVVAICGIIMQIIFYLISRRKYIKEVI